RASKPARAERPVIPVVRKRPVRGAFSLWAPGRQPGAPESLLFALAGPYDRGMILAPLAAVLLLTLNPFAGLARDRAAAPQEEPPTAEERLAQREAALDRLYGELAAAESAEAA